MVFGCIATGPGVRTSGSDPGTRSGGGSDGGADRSGGVDAVVCSPGGWAAVWSP